MFKKKIKKFTKKDQANAIKEIIRLLNEYHLTITTEHTIKIVPFETKEDRDES